MEGIKKAAIDTNLLVRYLTDDDPRKAKAVDHLLQRASNGEIRIVIPGIVLAELVWVLESFYRMEPGKICELAAAILNTPGVEVAEKAVISSALELYGTRNIDLVDAWIMEFARHRDIKTIYTFDRKHFRDEDGIEIRTP